MAVVRQTRVGARTQACEPPERRWLHALDHADFHAAFRRALQPHVVHEVANEENAAAARSAEVLRVSAKTGEGVEELLNTIVDQVPPPHGDPDAPARALIFDSVYDTYRGVVTYVRVVDGRLSKRERMLMMSTQAVHETLELGVICPEPHPDRRPRRRRGRLRHLRREGRPPGPRRRHDHHDDQQAGEASRWRATTTPSPWSSPASTRSTATSTRTCGTPWTSCRLNDAALVYEPETSTALGFGFRCGFLGLLHMEIVRERLEREFDLSLISTAPNVVYRVVMESGRELTVTNPSDFPGGIDGFSAGDGQPQGQHRRQDQGSLRAGRPGHGHLPDATTSARSWSCARAAAACSRAWTTCPPTGSRSATRCRSAEIIFDFFDQLKSRTRGYASLDYEPDGEQVANLVKVDILLQGQPVDAFSQIVHSDSAREYGLSMTAKLKELIPRQQFEVPIQAAVGSPDHRPGEHPRAAQGRPRQVLRR